VNPRRIDGMQGVRGSNPLSSTGRRRPPAKHDHAALAGEFLRRPGQPSPADPGLTGQHDGAAVTRTGGIEGRRKQTQLVVAADNNGTQ
jgi:hypothetical protein